MKRIIALSLISAFSFGLTACDAPPVKDGKCVQIPAGALPVALDPDCPATTPKK
ncbi:MAG: hypothetical protein U0354_03850 [Candidatus Sericytochromatia bacterium]